MDGKVSSDWPFSGPSAMASAIEQQRIFAEEAEMKHQPQGDQGNKNQEFPPKKDG